MNKVHLGMSLQLLSCGEYKITTWLLIFPDILIVPVRFTSVDELYLISDNEY